MRKSHLATSCALLAGLSLGQSQVSFAGFGGQMNGSGFGIANANVTPPGSVNVPAQNSSTGPSAAVNPLTANPLTGGAYKSVVTLPPGASSQLGGLPGYIWKGSTSVSGGATADNPTIESLTDVTPASVATLTLNAGFNADTRAFTFQGTATDGSAVFVKIFTTPDTQSFADTQSTLSDDFTGFTVGKVWYSNLYLGKGDLSLPTASLPPDTQYSFSFTLPKDVPLDSVILEVDGYAASTAPESGCVALAFALTVGGMFCVRRVIAPAAIAS